MVKLLVPPDLVVLRHSFFNNPPQFLYRWGLQQQRAVFVLGAADEGLHLRVIFGTVESVGNVHLILNNQSTRPIVAG